MSEPSPIQDSAETPAAVAESSDTANTSEENANNYWNANLKILWSLLAVWAAVSYGAGILFVEPLNNITFPFSSCPLGFWFSQQGSIFVFIALIYVYVRLMNSLDRRMGVAEDD